MLLDSRLILKLGSMWTGVLWENMKIRGMELMEIYILKFTITDTEVNFIRLKV